MDHTDFFMVFIFVQTATQLPTICLSTESVVDLMSQVLRITSNVTTDPFPSLGNLVYLNVKTTTS